VNLKNRLASFADFELEIFKKWHKSAFLWHKMQILSESLTQILQSVPTKSPFHSLSAFYAGQPCPATYFI
jgi:hypothetical protein